MSNYESLANSLISADNLIAISRVFTVPHHIILGFLLLPSLGLIRDCITRVDLEVPEVFSLGASELELAWRIKSGTNGFSAFGTV